MFRLLHQELLGTFPFRDAHPRRACVRSPVVRAPAADGQAGERGSDGARSDVAFGVSEALVGPGAIESERAGKS